MEGMDTNIDCAPLTLDSFGHSRGSRVANSSKYSSVQFTRFTSFRKVHSQPSQHSLVYSRVDDDKEYKLEDIIERIERNYR
jgi:hypothetical protein